jgi:hypothetical protein
LGYQVFRCRECKRSFNSRTGTPFNFLEVPTDIVFQVLLCRLRYKMSFRDVAEFFLLRGFEFTPGEGAGLGGTLYTDICPATVSQAQG